MKDVTVIKELMMLGLRPKYKAFNYMLFITNKYEPHELLNMSDSEIMNTIADEYNVDVRVVRTNMRTLISSCMEKIQICNVIRTNLPTLDKYELPTIKEFSVAVGYSLDHVD